MVNCVIANPYAALNMEFKSFLSSAISADSSSAPSPSPSVNEPRQSRRSDAEKLDLVCNYMRKELHWGVSDFTRALAFSKGPANARRKAAFSAAAYKDSEVLKSYFGNAGQLQDGVRQSKSRHWI